jgi:GH15 family glucan-1,4-alpha-glucosidase
MIEATRGSRSQDEKYLSVLTASSARLIRELQEDSGAYPASPTFSAYRGYSWFRDGAFIADGMSVVGEVESASRFFDWCSEILLGRESQVLEIVARAAAGNPVPDHEMLPTRFTFDGADGTDEWWDFQLDGYGTWLWAMAAHCERHGLDPSRWRAAAELTIQYLVASWKRPCFDWWEEASDQVHVSTLGCIAAGLRAVAGLGVIDGSLRRSSGDAATAIVDVIAAEGVHDGHLAKWLGSTAVDASLLAIVAPLAVFPVSTEIGRLTVVAVADSLNVDGGVHRYLGDTFFGGGQWPLLSCFLGLGHLALGDRESAAAELRWVAATADLEGNLPEQVTDHLLDPSRFDEWVDRWGPSARPLLWSHAMFLRLAAEFGVDTGVAK